MKAETVRLTIPNKVELLGTKYQVRSTKSEIGKMEYCLLFTDLCLLRLPTGHYEMYKVQSTKYQVSSIWYVEFRETDLCLLRPTFGRQAGCCLLITAY